jgi:hypothetical protein
MGGIVGVAGGETDSHSWPPFMKCGGIAAGGNIAARNRRAQIEAQSL